MVCFGDLSPYGFPSTVTVPVANLTLLTAHEIGVSWLIGVVRKSIWLDNAHDSREFGTVC